VQSTAEPKARKRRYDEQKGYYRHEFQIKISYIVAQIALDKENTQEKLKSEFSNPLSLPGEDQGRVKVFQESSRNKTNSLLDLRKNLF